jgi:hypothetical protein
VSWRNPSDLCNVRSSASPLSTTVLVPVPSSSIPLQQITHPSGSHNATPHFGPQASHTSLVSNPVPTAGAGPSSLLRAAARYRGHRLMEALLVLATKERECLPPYIDTNECRSEDRLIFRFTLCLTACLTCEEDDPLKVTLQVSASLGNLGNCLKDSD